MAKIKYNEIIGIFSQDGNYRLDIGSDAVKKEASANHVSWATTLVIKRLDGLNEGEVEDTHIIGIFSQDMKYRLDIGTDMMKKNVPATHESWATKLKIKKVEGESTEYINYGDVIGIFSEDGRCRLDIGSASIKKEVPATHESWATRLKILDSDPIIAQTLLNMEYLKDEVNVDSLPVEEIGIYSQTIDNSQFEFYKTSIIHCVEKVAEHSMWQNTTKPSFCNETTFNIGIPTIINGKIEIVYTENDIYKYELDYLREKKWPFKETVKVPAHCIAKLQFVVSKSPLKIPYTATFECKTLNGIIKKVKIEGIYIGDSTYDLKVISTLVDTLNNKTEEISSLI